MMPCKIWTEQNIFKSAMFLLTAVILCHRQVDREPAAVPAVKAVAETPELPSLSILG